jgi:hypothetical protein
MVFSVFSNITELAFSKNFENGLTVKLATPLFVSLLLTKMVSGNRYNCSVTLFKVSAFGKVVITFSVVVFCAEAIGANSNRLLKNGTIFLIIENF